jgi:hypothetical protein
MIKTISNFIVLILAAVLVTSCANKDLFLKALGSPEVVQWDITTLGSIAKPRITSDKAKAAIHKFATDLVAASDLDSSQLEALIPHTGDAAADELIASAVKYLKAVVAKVGSHNQTTRTYLKAVGNGILFAGF